MSSSFKQLLILKATFFFKLIHNNKEIKVSKADAQQPKAGTFLKLTYNNRKLTIFKKLIHNRPTL